MEAGHIEAADKRTALVIAILALFLAVVETGAKSAQTEALTFNVEASNLWAFFQARTVRQTTATTAVQAAELQKLATPDPAARSAIEAQQKAWRDQVANWESNDKNDGRKELSARAQDAETRRERYMAQYHFYEYAAGLLQVAIVIASATIITNTPLLLILSLALASGGVALSAIGFLAPGLFHLG